jgi:hypothetical protein
VITINGLAFMGGVDVKRRPTLQAAREARQLRNDARRDRRDYHRERRDLRRGGDPS